MIVFTRKLMAAGLASLALVTAALADSASDHQHAPAVERAGETSMEAIAPAAAPTTMHENMMAPGLKMPSMDPVRGRQLFASKGCVVCHSINGVGGEDASPFDFATMSEPTMNPFEFAARMWRGAEAMIMLQREELGNQIELTGDELSDIIAFAHNEEQQKAFSLDDVPPAMRELIAHGHGTGAEHNGGQGEEDAEEPH